MFCLHLMFKPGELDLLYNDYYTIKLLMITVLYLYEGLLFVKLH